MKKLFSFLLLALSFCQVYSQENTEDYFEQQKRFCVTIGVLQGGGSLIGADLEALVSKRIGIQAGAGLMGFGAGLNIHLKPSISSSFISLQYWHQGIGSNYVQSILGPTFVYRAKKLFTAQLGFGFALEKGPGWPVDKTQPPAMLMYSLGIYLPW